MLLYLNNLYDCLPDFGPGISGKSYPVGGKTGRSFHAEPGFTAVDAVLPHRSWPGKQGGSAGCIPRDWRQRTRDVCHLRDKSTDGFLDQADQMGHQEGGQAQGHCREHPDTGMGESDNNLFYHLIRSHLRDHSLQGPYRSPERISLMFLTFFAFFMVSLSSFGFWEGKSELKDHGDVVSGPRLIFQRKSPACPAQFGGIAFFGSF